MTNGLNVREMALEILLEVEKSGAYPNVLLKQTLDKYLYMEKQERAFLTRLVEGTVERKLTLEYYVNKVSKTPVGKMKPVIRCIMRMAVYQIFFMDSVPDSAACNEAVKLAQKKGFHTLKGFVNGVLRNLSRQKELIVLPDEEKEPVCLLYHRNEAGFVYIIIVFAADDCEVHHTVRQTLSVGYYIFHWIHLLSSC